MTIIHSYAEPPQTKTARNESKPTEPTRVELKRSLNLPLLTLYGLGTTIGAGIYVLIGTVVGQAGMQAPFAFLLAGIVAAFTAFSFAELGTRYPRSAGEAVYINAAFGSIRLSTLVGLVVATTSMISAAAILSGASGYVRLFVDLPNAWILVLVTVGLGLLAGWGITQSAVVAGIVTLMELAGLGAVVWFGVRGTPDILAHAPEILPPLEFSPWNGIMIGAVLAFFAFIGFEDMVNLAEETVDVRRTLPWAITLTLVISSVLYFLVVSVAVLAVPVAELASSETPIALIIAKGIDMSPRVIGAVTVFATLNGALVQLVLASRVFYGLSSEGGIPKLFGYVHPNTQTPLVATGIAVAVVLTLTLVFPLEELARFTSLMTLSIFSIVNVALIRIKQREVSVKDRAEDVVRYPFWVPLMGAIVSIAILGIEVVRLMG